jgi:Tfp pilus assembly protein PilF
LYLKSPASVEHRDLNLSFIECERVRERYRSLRRQVVQERFEEAKRLLEKGQFEVALDLLLRILQVDIGHFDSICVLAELCEQTGRPKEALNIWKMAVDQQPHNSMVVNNVARLRAGLHASPLPDVLTRPESAGDDETGVPKGNPIAGLPAKNPGWQGTIRLSGSYQAADADDVGAGTRQSLPAQQDQRDLQVRTLYATGADLAEKGRTGEALKVLSRLRELAPTHRDALALMARIYTDLGEPDKAKTLQTILEQ